MDIIGWCMKSDVKWVRLIDKTYPEWVKIPCYLLTPLTPIVLMIVGIKTGYQPLLTISIWWMCVIAAIMTLWAWVAILKLVLLAVALLGCFLKEALFS